MKCSPDDLNSQCAKLAELVTTQTAETVAVDPCTGCPDETPDKGCGIDVLDGWYDKVQIVNGCVVKAEKGAAVTHTTLNTDCCDDGESKPADIELLVDKCNMLRKVEGRLMAEFKFKECDSFVTQQGCGTSADPYCFKIDWDGVRDQVLEGGLDYEKCGVKIEDGVIKSMPSIVVGAENHSKGLVNFWYDTNDCKIHFEVLGASDRTPVSTRDFTCSGGAVAPVALPNCSGQTLIVGGTAGTAGVYLNADGSYSVGYQMWNSGFETVRFSADPPATFSNLGSAELWLAQNAQLTTGCPTRCEDEAGPV